MGKFHDKKPDKSKTVHQFGVEEQEIVGAPRKGFLRIQKQTFFFGDVE